MHSRKGSRSLECLFLNGPLTKSAAEASPITKTSDGNDRDRNDELGIKHPFRESTDGSSITESVFCAIQLYDLPLEMLDVILQKSYLQWVLNSSAKHRDEEVISSLISVDVCFNKRITRQRFKMAIWRYLKDFYGKTKKRHAIIRNNRNYLENNIQSNDELISSLLSLNCITDEQRHFIQRKRSAQDKNNALLYVVQSFDETKFSTFVNCLRRTNQRTVAKIIENGGGIIKFQVKTRDAKCEASLETKINDLRDRTKSRSHETDKLIAQMREEGLEILSSQLDGQTVVVWIWCYSQTAVENLQRLYESNQLRDEYFENIQPSISKFINIDANQLKTTVVLRPININVTQRIEMSENEGTWGVAKLRNKIYVLYRAKVFRIRVFEDLYPFRHQTDIRIGMIVDPRDIGSSEKENCLYVSDSVVKCVWKITREAHYQNKIIKWLTTDYKPRWLSVSRDGVLLVINKSSHSLMIYGSDAEHIRSIPLSRDIKNPYHAIETSIGNFIIVDKRKNEKDEDEEDGKKEDVVMEEGKHWPVDWLESRQGKDGSSRKNGEWLDVVSELTRDGQKVIRRFILSNETQELNYMFYGSLLIDSDDRVFVAEQHNSRVILLDSDLKWNRILCPTKEENEQQILRNPWRLFYDEEMKQLIVGAYFGDHIKVYTLSRN